MPTASSPKFSQLFNQENHQETTHAGTQPTKMNGFRSQRAIIGYSMENKYTSNTFKTINTENWASCKIPCVKPTNHAQITSLKASRFLQILPSTIFNLKQLDIVLCNTRGKSIVLYNWKCQSLDDLCHKEWREKREGDTHTHTHTHHRASTSLENCSTNHLVAKRNLPMNRLLVY